MAVKTYACKVLSNNKKTGGFMVQAKDDNGKTVTRHLDMNMRGKNPNDDAPKRHSKLLGQIEDERFSIARIEDNIIAFKKAREKAKKEGKEFGGIIEIMDDAALSIVEGVLQPRKDDLNSLLKEKHKLEEELPLIAQFHL